MTDIEPQGVTDREILSSVEETLLHVILPSLREDAEWARAIALQLAGLAGYAATRAADTTAECIDEIVAVLQNLTNNEIVRKVWAGETTQRAVMEAAGAVLAAAAGRDDAAANEARGQLRPVLVRQLDDELAEAAGLVDVFRGGRRG